MDLFKNPVHAVSFPRKRESMFVVVVEKKAARIPDRDTRDKQRFLEIPNR